MFTVISHLIFYKYVASRSIYKIVTILFWVTKNEESEAVSCHHYLVIPFISQLSETKPLQTLFVRGNSDKQLVIPLSYTAKQSSSKDEWWW